MLWSGRQRRLRIDNIPTIKYSCNLIIAQDKLNDNDIEPSEPTDDSKSEEQKEYELNQYGPIDAENLRFIGNNEDRNQALLNTLHNETCNVCLEDFVEGENIKLLRCKHGFHDKCIKSWIVKRGKCPVCIRDVFLNDNDYMNDRHDQEYFY